MENEIFENIVENEPEAQQPVEEQIVEQPIEEQGTNLQDTLNEWKSNPVEKIKSISSKVWIALGAGVVAIVALILVLGALNNNYKTPIQNVEKLLNTKSLTKIIDKAPTVLNGFGESEAKQIIKILKKSDAYEENIEYAEEEFEEAIDMLKEQLGDNYKIKIKVEEKDKLDKDDCKDFRNELKEYSKMALEELDEAKDYDDFYDDMADEIGISKSDAKKIVAAAEEFLKECKSAKVTAGYELDLVISVTGSEIDDPEETQIELSVNVFKINGRWFIDVISLVEDMDYGFLYGLMSVASGF